MQIRFPEGSDLRDRLNEAARLNNRSLTAEIMHRLEMSIAGIEARLGGNERGIRDVGDLSSDQDDRLWELSASVERLEDQVATILNRIGLPDGKSSKPSKRKVG
ncbi:Arc family DNA-binding protein [Mesorhizobium metallidurans]|nr:Arc family DNA-binding protein [Mesorhizobium metallidurans]